MDSMQKMSWIIGYALITGLNVFIGIGNYTGNWLFASSLGVATFMIANVATTAAIKDW